jgi:hypothetical protein
LKNEEQLISFCDKLVNKMDVDTKELEKYKSKEDKTKIFDYIVNHYKDKQDQLSKLLESALNDKKSSIYKLYHLSSGLFAPDVSRKGSVLYKINQKFTSIHRASSGSSATTAHVMNVKPDNAHQKLLSTKQENIVAETVNGVVSEKQKISKPCEPLISSVYKKFIYPLTYPAVPKQKEAFPDFPKIPRKNDLASTAEKSLFAASNQTHSKISLSNDKNTSLAHQKIERRQKILS